MSNESEYRDLSKRYRRKHDDLLDLHERIELVKAKFSKRRGDVVERYAVTEVTKRLESEFREDAAKLERMVEDYERAREDLVELRKRFE